MRSSTVCGLSVTQEMPSTTAWMSTSRTTLLPNRPPRPLPQAQQQRLQHPHLRPPLSLAPQSQVLPYQVLRLRREACQHQQVRPVLGTTPSRTRPCFSSLVAKFVARSILELFLPFKCCSCLLQRIPLHFSHLLKLHFICFWLQHRVSIILAHRKDSDRNEDLIGISILQVIESIISFTSALPLVFATIVGLSQDLNTRYTGRSKWSSHSQALQIALKRCNHCSCDLLQRLCARSRKINVLRMAL